MSSIEGAIPDIKGLHLLYYCILHISCIRGAIQDIKGLHLLYYCIVEDTLYPLCSTDGNTPYPLCSHQPNKQDLLLPLKKCSEKNYFILAVFFRYGIMLFQ